MANKSKKVQFHKDIKRRRIRKSLSERIKRLNKKENHYRTCQDQAQELVMAPQQQLVKVEPRNKVIFKKGMLNFIQSLNSRIGTKVNFLLFGMVYFDEEALKNHNRDRSLLKSMFNFYSINFAKITPTFLILKIHLNFENIYPVAYIIERFKSEGKKDFYELAQFLQVMHNRFINFQRLKTPSLYDHQVDKQLQKSAGKPCMLMISPNIIAISKELIQLTGYSMEYMASSCLLNRSFLFDLLLSDDYMDEVMSYFSKMDLNGRLRKGELTLQEYREHSSYQSQGSIIDKSNNRIKVKTRRNNLQIGIACWSVQKVVGRQKLMQSVNFWNKGQRVNFEQVKKQKDLKEMNKLVFQTVAKSESSKEKITSVCGYKCIEELKVENT